MIVGTRIQPQDMIQPHGNAHMVKTMTDGVLRCDCAHVRIVHRIDGHQELAGVTKMVVYDIRVKLNDQMAEESELKLQLKETAIDSTYGSKGESELRHDHLKTSMALMVALVEKRKIGRLVAVCDGRALGNMGGRKSALVRVGHHWSSELDVVRCETVSEEFAV